MKKAKKQNIEFTQIGSFRNSEIYYLEQKNSEASELREIKEIIQKGPINRLYFSGQLSFNKIKIFFVSGNILSEAHFNFIVSDEEYNNAKLWEKILNNLKKRFPSKKGDEPGVWPFATGAILNDPAAWHLLPLSKQILQGEVTEKKSDLSDDDQKMENEESDLETETDEEKFEEAVRENSKTSWPWSKKSKSSDSKNKTVFTSEDKTHIIIDFGTRRKAEYAIQTYKELFPGTHIALYVKQYIVIYKNLFEEFCKTSSCSNDALKSDIDEYFAQETKPLPLSVEKFNEFREFATGHVGHRWGKKGDNIKEGDPSYKIELLFKNDYANCGYKIVTLNKLISRLKNAKWYRAISDNAKNTEVSNSYTFLITQLSSKGFYKFCEFLRLRPDLSNFIIKYRRLIIFYNYKELPTEFENLKKHLNAIADNLDAITMSDGDLKSRLTSIFKAIKKSKLQLGTEIRTAFTAVYEQFLLQTSNTSQEDLLRPQKNRGNVKLVEELHDEKSVDGKASESGNKFSSAERFRESAKRKKDYLTKFYEEMERKNKRHEQQPADPTENSQTSNNKSSLELSKN